ncbi:hypothetical protein F5B22DRAFT_518282 [Xylaria bambusicola]|uniref:uncharacterized protein n=1 Tax=Xylaria bambusicola TaxID=326684 RepID=UPI002007ECB0|nr:uncharacterized protein F5B22DRAFT_518282 [Xylaria bambusicola]KAI0505538.1 hypothetical protein F5B22DRAFT_518282 [Xylaria bambusicola]
MGEIGLKQISNASGKACNDNDNMVNPELLSRPQANVEPTKARSRRIEIWQREVVTSSKACACSAPTTQARNSGLGTLYRRSMSRFDISHLHHDPDDYPSNPWTLKSPRSSLQGDCTGPHCPVCALPLGGVKYKLLSRDDSGLVRQRSPSPPRISRDDELSQGRGQKTKSKSVLRRIVRVIKPSKGLTSNEIAEMSRTDMYRDLRPETTSPPKDVHDDTSSGLSDEDCKKPKVGITASAARLRRAQVLLQRGKRAD